MKYILSTTFENVEYLFFLFKFDDLNNFKSIFKFSNSGLEIDKYLSLKLPVTDRCQLN